METEFGFSTRESLEMIPTLEATLDNAIDVCERFDREINRALNPFLDELSRDKLAEIRLKVEKARKVLEEVSDGCDLDVAEEYLKMDLCDGA